MIDVQNSNYVVLQGLRLQNSSQVGIRYYNSQFGEIRDCSGSRLPAAMAFICKMRTTPSWRPSPSRVSARTTGIRLTDSNDVQITHSVIYHNAGYGIYLRGACRTLVDTNEAV